MKRLMASSAVVAALVALAVALAFKPWAADDDGSHLPGAITVREDRGPPAVAAPGAPPELPTEFQILARRGFDEAPAALPDATALVPFPTYLPDYLPQEVKLWHVRAALEPKSGKALLELYYTLPPDGTTQPAVHLIQSNAEAPPEVTPPPAEGVYPRTLRGGTFTAGGLRWRYGVLEFPDLNMIRAETTTAEGAWVEADIRVVGMDEGTAVAELQRVLE
jgi:hypothetical protein